MKNLLLLDVNDTLDDASDMLMRYYMYRDGASRLPDFSKYRWVMPQRGGMLAFRDMLQRYKEKIHIVFWTSVPLIWQKYVAEKYLEMDDCFLFDSHLWCQHISDYDSKERGSGIWTPKSKHISELTHYFGNQVWNIIWFVWKSYFFKIRIYII